MQHVINESAWIAIVPDEGEVVAFKGVEKCRFELYASDLALQKLDITIYENTDAHGVRAAAHVLVKNMSNPLSDDVADAAGNVKAFDVTVEEFLRNPNHLQISAYRSSVRESRLGSSPARLCFKSSSVDGLRRELALSFPQSGIQALLVEHLGECEASTIRTWFLDFLGKRRAGIGRKGSAAVAGKVS